MPVEIEEMSATVVPEPTSRPNEPAEPSQPQPKAANLDSDLRRWVKRQLRLKAD